MGNKNLIERLNLRACLEGTATEDLFTEAAAALQLQEWNPNMEEAPRDRKIWGKLAGGSILILEYGLYAGKYMWTSVNSTWGDECHPVEWMPTPEEAK